MTKTQLILAVHEKMDGSITKDQVKDFLEALKVTAVDTLSKEGNFTIPDLVKIVVVTTNAKPERTARNPFTGATMQVAAKPKGKKLKARFVKYLKSEVGQDAPEPAAATVSTAN